MDNYIDITMTATIRPEIIEKSLKTIKKKIINKNKNYDFRLIVNIDPIGETSTCSQDDIEFLISKYHDNFITIKPEKPSFPLAIKNLWSLIEADYVLHTEDDRIYLRRVDFESIISFFDSNVGMIRLETEIERFNRPNSGFKAEKYKKHTFIIKSGKYPKKLISFQPTVYRKEVLYQLKDFIKENSSPEGTLRLEDTKSTKEEKKKIAKALSSGNYLIYFDSFHKFSKDIGTKGKRDMNFVKDSKEGITNSGIRKR